MRQYQARPFVVRSVEINSHLPAGEQWQTVLRRCSALAGRNWRPPPLITNNSLQAVDFCNLNLSNTSTFAVSSPTCEMSGHVPSSWQDLPLMGEVGNLWCVIMPIAIVDPNHTDYYFHPKPSPPRAREEQEARFRSQEHDR